MAILDTDYLLALETKTDIGWSYPFTIEKPNFIQPAEAEEHGTLKCHEESLILAHNQELRKLKGENSELQSTWCRTNPRVTGNGCQVAEKYLAVEIEKCTRPNTYPEHRLEHCSQLPDVSTKWAIRSPRQHFWCRLPPILAVTDPSSWKAGHSSRRWVRMWIKRNREFKIIDVVSNWEQAPKRC